MCVYSVGVWMVPCIGDLVAQYFTEDVMSSLPVPASRLAFCQGGGSWDAATQDIPSGAGVTQRKLKGYLAPQATDRQESSALLPFMGWYVQYEVRCCGVQTPSSWACRSL